MTAINQWAQRWRVPPQALTELDILMYSEVQQETMNVAAKSEEAVAQRIVLAGPSINQSLWRNNSGALYDNDGRLIRFGVANTSKRINDKFKSSDYIGITELTVLPNHVGMKLGVFTAIETKKEGWLAPQNEREQAQLNFLKKVNIMGGIGMFATSAKQVENTVIKLRGE